MENWEPMQLKREGETLSNTKFGMIVGLLAIAMVLIAQVGACAISGHYKVKAVQSEQITKDKTNDNH